MEDKLDINVTDITHQLQRNIVKFKRELQELKIQRTETTDSLYIISEKITFMTKIQDELQSIQKFMTETAVMTDEQQSYVRRYK